MAVTKQETVICYILRRSISLLLIWMYSPQLEAFVGGIHDQKLGMDDIIQK
jgi:hypothetical protein